MAGKYSLKALVGVTIEHQSKTEWGDRVTGRESMLVKIVASKRVTGEVTRHLVNQQGFLLSKDVTNSVNIHQYCDAAGKILRSCQQNNSADVKRWT